MLNTAPNTNASAATIAQKTSYRLELPNGYPPQLNSYIARIMRSQDLEAWKANPAGLGEFIRTAVAGYMAQVSVVIVTRA